MPADEAAQTGPDDLALQAVHARGAGEALQLVHQAQVVAVRAVLALDGELRPLRAVGGGGAQQRGDAAGRAVVALRAHVARRLVGRVLVRAAGAQRGARRARGAGAGQPSRLLPKLAD